MSIEIVSPRLASASAPRPVLFSGNQEGSLGGPTLPVPRLGDRFAVDLRTTQLRQDRDSRLLIADLIEATTADAKFALQQYNLDRRSAQSVPAVNGAGQTGSTLSVRSVFPGTALVRGQFISIVHASRHYLHMVTQQVVAPANGIVAISLWPMLRFITVDSEPVAITRPMIEGQLVGFEGKGATFVKNRVDPLEFSIVERA